MRLPIVLAATILLGACSTEEDDGPPPCTADANEPNDSAAEATSLGTLQDDSVLGQKDAAPKKLFKAFSTHAEGDVDWYTVNVRDTGIGGNPKIGVIVGDGYEATAFWSCTNGPTELVRCTIGTSVTSDPDMPSAQGCQTVLRGAPEPPRLAMEIECSGTPTDSGKLLIRVKRSVPSNTCERYTLFVGVE